jgi:hypothetical protein
VLAKEAVGLIDMDGSLDIDDSLEWSSPSGLKAVLAVIE